MTTNRPTDLFAPASRAAHRLLIEIALGRGKVTRFYAAEPGLKKLHRRGLIASRRYGERHWRHEITPLGRAALLGHA
jgi:hypothetical protein